MRRIAALPPQKAALAKLAFVGLQQRLLSSIAAFAHTLAVHRRSLLRLIEGSETARETVAARAFVSSGSESAELGLEDDSAEAAIDADEEAAVEAASRAGAVAATREALRSELAAVDDMLAVAERARPGATRARTGW
jgi:hypothetical protein